MFFRKRGKFQHDEDTGLTYLPRNDFERVVIMLLNDLQKRHDSLVIELEKAQAIKKQPKVTKKVVKKKRK